MKSKYTCRHCNHKWVPRKKDPKRCPNCKRTNWRKKSDRPKATKMGDDSILPGVFQG